jgi:hypothetical protein
LTQKNNGALGGRGAAVSDKIRSKVNPTKFGFAERRVSPRREQPGKLAFDDRGNAQYEWRDDRMMEEGEDAETRRLRALSVANLVLVDDEPPPEAKKVPLNKRGVRQGYNPYDSGMLKKDAYKKPRDLRALSKWIEMQNKPARQDADD